MKLKSILLGVSAVLGAAGAYAQTNVTTGGQKYTLVEEGTGTWCQWCPDGAQVLQEKILPYGTSTNYPRAIVASFHNGNSDSMLIRAPYNDPFNNGTGYITGFPMGTVDRAPYPSATSPVGLSRGSWAAATGVRDAMSPNFDVSMVCLYDSSTRIITIKVKAKALKATTGPYRINAYIVEDSISSAPVGYRQISASQLNSGSVSSATGSPSWFIGKGTTLSSPTVYSHMDAVRKILSTTGTGGIWGDVVTKFNGAIAIGDSAEVTYYDTIPTTYRGRTCYKSMTKVIGLVQKYGTTTTDRAIDNCIEAKVKLMWKTLPSTGVTYVTPMQDIEIYPNPAREILTVKGILENPSEVNITINNALGQQVYSTRFAKGGSMFGENISLADFSNGIYFMNIVTEGGNVTKQFVVSK